VQKGQAIAEVESNKAVFELEASASGPLHIAVPAGQTVPILTLIATIGDGAAQPAAAPSAASAPPAEAAPAREPAGAAAAPPAQDGGTVRHFVSPRARRFAREKGVDVALVAGSGPEGRVEERDVRAYLERAPRLSPLARRIAEAGGVSLPPADAPRTRIMRSDLAVPKPVAPQPTAPAPKAPPTTADVAATTPMGTVRRIIAQRMAESSRSTAAVTLTTEVDATELVHLREQLKAAVQQKTGQSLSYNVLLAKICGLALESYPYMNVRLAGDSIETIRSTNVGIAVDTERGLVVPVLRAAAHKSLLALSQEAAGLFAKAVSGSIGADEMAGGSITITNVGQFGIDAFTPIINLPECSILGVGRIAPRPAVHEGQLAVRQIVVLSLTFDHRLVDGAPAARFLQAIAQMVANPYVLLLE
jgi:pyruvate dehydrogenase E2 component (dihydrolipoamide acetyltransferase)